MILRDITERKLQEGSTQPLLREVNHRAKNLLGVVQVIASQTAAGNAEDFITRFFPNVSRHFRQTKICWLNANGGS